MFKEAQHVDLFRRKRENSFSASTNEPEDFATALMRNNISDLRNTEGADRRNNIILKPPRQGSDGKKETPNTKKKVQIFVSQKTQSKMPVQSSMSKMSKIDSIIVSNSNPSKLGNYKLFNLKEGSFAFKDKQSIKQPEYKLAFEERDLVGYLKMQERNDNIKKRKGGRFRFGSTLENQPVEQATPSPLLGSSHSEGVLNTQKTAVQNQPPKMFELIQVRYKNDRKFPFRMFDEVAKVLHKSVKEGIKQQSFQDRHDLYSEDPNANELQRFIQNNEPGLKNLVIYMFWIIIDKWFGTVVNFTESFVEEIKGAMNRQYLQIYFGYLIRIQRDCMDQILEVLPYLLAETIRNLIQDKIKGHMLVLNTTSHTYTLLNSICFSELFGYEISELALHKLQEKYIISDLDRLRHNKKTSPFSSQRQRKMSPKRGGNDQQTALNKAQTTQSGGGSSSINNNNNTLSNKSTTFKKLTSNLPTFMSRATMIQKDALSGQKSSFNYDVPGAKKIASKESRDMYRAIANEITQKWNQVESSEAKKMINEQIMEYTRQERESRSPSPTNLSPRQELENQSSEKKKLSTRKVLNFQENRLGKTKTGSNLSSALKTKLRNRLTMAIRKGNPQQMLGGGGGESDDSLMLNNSRRGSPLLNNFRQGTIAKGVNFDASVQSRITLDSVRESGESTKMQRWRSVTVRVKKKEKGLLGEDLQKKKRKNQFKKQIKKLDQQIPKIDTKYEELYSLSRVTAKAEPGVVRTTKFNMMHLSPTLKPQFEHTLLSQFGNKSKQKRLTIRAEPNRVLAERHTKMKYFLTRDASEKARQNESQNLKRSESVPLITSNRESNLLQKAGVEKVELEIQKYMTYVRSAAAKEIQLQMQEQDAKFYGKLEIADPQMQNQQKENQNGGEMAPQGTEFAKRGRPLVDPTSGTDSEMKNDIAIKAMIKMQEEKKLKENEALRKNATSVPNDKRSTLRSQNSFGMTAKQSPRKQVRIQSQNMDKQTTPSRATTPKSFAATIPTVSLQKVGDGAHFFKDKNFKEAGQVWAQVDSRKDKMKNKRISVDKASEDCLSRAMTMQSDMSSSQPILNIQDKSAFLYRESADDIQMLTKRVQRERSNLLSQTDKQPKEIVKQFKSRNSIFPSIEENQFVYNSQNQTNPYQVDLNRTSTLQSSFSNSKVLLQAHKAQAQQLQLPPQNLGKKKQSKKGIVTQTQYIKAVAGIKDTRQKRESYELSESAHRIDERDLNRSLQKTQSRILRDSKTRITHDGSLKDHLQLQLVEYMKGKDTQESLKAEQTVQMEQFVKKRLQAIQPVSVRELEKEKKMEERRKERRRSKFNSQTPLPRFGVAFPNQPIMNSQPQLGRMPDESVADKHTYTSLRKSSSKKTRNQFVFHEYEQKRAREKKRQEQIERQIRMEVGGGQALLHEKTQAEKEAETKKLFEQEQFRKKRAILESQLKKEESLKLRKESVKLEKHVKAKSLIQLKTSFLDVEGNKTQEASREQSGRNSRNDMTQTGDQTNKTSGVPAVPDKMKVKQSSMKDSLKAAIQEMIQEKEIEILNEIDEKIDEREGINQFKGRVLRVANTINTNFNIKGQGHLKRGGSTRDLKRRDKKIENEQKAYMQKLKEQQMNDELDSEEENERFDQNQEVELLQKSEPGFKSATAKDPKQIATNFGSKTREYMANIDKRKKAREERLRKKGGLILARTSTLQF